MKHCRVSAFARVARVIAYAAVALGLGAGSLLAQGSTGKIEGRVRDQAGAPIANAQVIIVGTAFNAAHEPPGLLLHQQRARRHGRRARRVHRVQVDPGRRREGARRPDDHGGHPAGADGGRDPGDHRRRADAAAGAARRGDHQAAARRRVRREPAGRPAQPASWRCSRAWWRAGRPNSSPSAAAATTRTPPTSTACRSRPATAAPARAALRPCSAARHPGRGRHGRLRSRRRSPPAPPRRSSATRRPA